MPLTPTEKIWMDGELVDWADATVHVLTHTMHYGSGVFEGIRAYPTDRGVAVFRLRDHIERLFTSAQVFMIDVPFTVDELVEATRDLVRVNGLDEGCYIRPLVYLGYGEMGLNPIPCPVNVSIAAWPWGTYLGDEGVANGVSMKISSWRRHDPNAVPTAAKGTGMYVNSSLAKVEAIKAGYDEAILLAPDGNVSECTGENIFIVRKGRLITPPTSDSGALEGITQQSVETIARDLGYAVTYEPLIRTDLYTADEAFLTGTAAEVVPIRAVDDRPVGTASRVRSPRSCSRPTSPPSGARSTSTRTGWTMSSDGPTLNDDSPTGGSHGLPVTPTPMGTAASHSHPLTPGQHAHAHGREAGRDGGAPIGSAGHDFDLPVLPDRRRRLRHHPAGRLPAGGAVAHRGRQAAGGRAARPPRGDLHRGRLAGSQSQGRGVLRPGPHRALAVSARPWWPSARPGGPAVRAEDDETLRHLVDARTEAVCIVAKSSEMHVVDALRTTLDEAVAMVADSVEFLRSNDLRVFLDAEHFFDGYKANPEFTLRILQAAEEAGAETLVLCDTNGGTLPYEVERIVARRAGRVRDPGRGPLPQRQRLCGGQLAGRGGGGRHPRPGVRQRLRRAGRQRRPVGGHPRPLPEAAGGHHPPRTGWSC